MKNILPFSLKDSPSLIERLLPVQKLSAEVYKERMAGSNQMLTGLGNYWKGRKPLVLNRACILGCLLPATGDDHRDLEIFEKLMAMDDESFAARAKRRPKPEEILSKLAVGRVSDYFTSEPDGLLPSSAPINFKDARFDKVKVRWRKDVPLIDRLRLESEMIVESSYRKRVDDSYRADEVVDVDAHIWESVNAHLGTNATSFPTLVDQLGIMRFGRRPTVADTFCGSGQIPFEAARLGCDVYASDLNPVACMLTKAALEIGGADDRTRLEQDERQKLLVQQIKSDLTELGIEADGHGWQAKVFLYCVEVVCPQTGWRVPLLQTLLVSKGYRVVAELEPNFEERRYEINIVQGATDSQMAAAEYGTVRTDGRGQDTYLTHMVSGKEYRTKISTLRGDFRRSDGTSGSKLRLWEASDFKPRQDDIFQERLYCVQWMRPKATGRQMQYEFRAVTEADQDRERQVEEFIETRLSEWQNNGWIPDMRIEPGASTDQPIRERGWTHWHHLFNPRQLLLNGLWAKYTSDGLGAIRLFKALNVNAKLSVWHRSHGGGGSVQNVFSNQALNTLFDYGSRAFDYLEPATRVNSVCNLPSSLRLVESISADEFKNSADIFVTDPPYGDAVNYDEILDFFIAWLRRNPPKELRNLIWDSRRSLSIKGSGEDFRQGMVAAYKRSAECMPDNGIQVIMFTHQSGSIWADMANIVWASGLQVTAAWYVVTETDSALREGSYVKGTVLLVLRKRNNNIKIGRDDLAWEIQEEVEEQVKNLTGLNQQAKGLYRSENVFEDADVQMAGYAAALRILTRYTTIDGRDMPSEALRPRTRGEKTFVDGLIDFAVATANQCLVPNSFEKAYWDKLSGVERFYLKMLELESRGAKSLDNYQNFAKAFKVRDFNPFLASSKANSARLKSAAELGRSEMGETSEFYLSVLRATLYAMMEIGSSIQSDDVLAHLKLNVANWFDSTQREMVVELANYIANILEALRPEEASTARIVRDLVQNERLG